MPQKMALRFEKAFGVKMDTLVRMQTAYDISKVRSRAGEIKVKKYVPAEKKEEKRPPLTNFPDDLLLSASNPSELWWSQGCI